jgi:hypothetical protein
MNRVVLWRHTVICGVDLKTPEAEWPLLMAIHKAYLQHQILFGVSVAEEQDTVCSCGFAEERPVSRVFYKQAFDLILLGKPQGLSPEEYKAKHLAAIRLFHESIQESLDVRTLYAAPITHYDCMIDVTPAIHFVKSTSSL